MSVNTKLTKMLESLNENDEATARKLFHEAIVEMAKDIYSEMEDFDLDDDMNFEGDDDLPEMEDDLDLDDLDLDFDDEDLFETDMEDDLESDMDMDMEDDMDSDMDIEDEMDAIDDEMSDVEDEGEGIESEIEELEGRIDDIEDAFAKLEAEFMSINNPDQAEDMPLSDMEEVDDEELSFDDEDEDEDETVKESVDLVKSKEAKNVVVKGHDGLPKKIKTDSKGQVTKLTAKDVKVKTHTSAAQKAGGNTAKSSKDMMKKS